MKRSEMIEIMHKNISSVLCTSVEFDKEDCSRLLEEMEKAGILPPLHHFSTSMNDFKVIAHCVNYGWEKENEA